jgi:hypothetical protein
MKKILLLLPALLISTALAANIQEIQDKITHETPKPENQFKLVGIKVKRWPQDQRKWVYVIGFDSGEEKYGSTSLRVGVFDMSNQTQLQTMFHDLPNVRLEAKKDEVNLESFSHFDLAKFEVKKREFAFGVRITSRNSGSGGGDKATRLLLFHPMESKLVKVFDQIMDLDSIAFGSSPSFPELEYTSVLEVDRKESSKEGFYNLTQKFHITRGSIAPSLKVFTWNSASSSYEPKP